MTSETAMDSPEVAVRSWLDGQSFGGIRVNAATFALDAAADGRPRTLWLRRAVSAAYYSAFHAVSLATTLQLAPGRPSRITTGRVARSTTDAWPRCAYGFVGRRETDPEARHQADYDHLHVVGKATALMRIAHTGVVPRVISGQCGGDACRLGASGCSALAGMPRGGGWLHRLCGLAGVLWAHARER